MQNLCHLTRRYLPIEPSASMLSSTALLFLIPLQVPRLQANSGGLPRASTRHTRLAHITPREGCNAAPRATLPHLQQLVQHSCAGLFTRGTCSDTGQGDHHFRLYSCVSLCVLIRRHTRKFVIQLLYEWVLIKLQCVSAIALARRTSTPSTACSASTCWAVHQRGMQ
jgi:hypothetical protein